ncbi:hypothetical protein [Thiocystis violacea]|uniref:hypothetical protein n=1 Tax=Thiocystis violacea TaxID=13725 RepID=UPI0019057504|nr:hypothetical protein [Thiocystis violacea]MBK1723270.1 hypothetical protein [Thiocystis violacea]
MKGAQIQKPPHRHAQRRRQSGAMTLLFGLLLLVGAGILAFSAGRTGVVEQRIANNELQSIGAEQAAEAGLDFARAWLARNVWLPGIEPPSPPQNRSTSGQIYDVLLTFIQTGNAICVRSTSLAVGDTALTATARSCFSQTGLFAVSPQTRMPPPLVLGGCMTSAPQASEIILSDESAIAAATGEQANASCLPAGSVQASTWSDRNQDRIFTPDEQGPSSDYRRASFEGCPDTDCAWRHLFELGFDQAVQLAKDAGHAFADKIPCGASSAPGIYVIEREGPIGALDLTGSCADEDGVDNRTIGTPSKPLLLIVPRTSGCPSFTEDISVYGIVYFEGDCASQTWAGAKIQGAVIWEGEAQAPGEDSMFIETHYGSGSALNAAFQVVTGAAHVPGTWRDWD